MCVCECVCVYVCMNLGNHEFGRQSWDNGVVGGIKKGIVQYRWGSHVCTSQKGDENFHKLQSLQYFVLLLHLF